jgi:hypothetical protein
MGAAKGCANFLEARMDVNLNLAQREACEAVWRAIADRREIKLGIIYDAKTGDRAAARKMVATAVGLLDEGQLRGLVKPEIEKYGAVRRDYVWRWSSVLDARDSLWRD